MPSPCGGFRVIPLCLRQDVAIFSLEPKFDDGVNNLEAFARFSDEVSIHKRLLVLGDGARST